jgi:predicted DNA-binding transcriptional regulator
MASLEHVVKALKIQLETPRSSQEKAGSTQKKGYKRRDWLLNNTSSELPPASKGVYKPHLSTPLDKGSINPIYQPHLSTPLDKGSINPIKNLSNMGLEKLRGNPLKIAQYFYEKIQSNPDKITPQMTQTEIMKTLQISKDSARTGLRFLLKTGVVKRVHFQIGKGGWSQYQLKESLMIEIKKAYQKGSIDPLNYKGSNSSSSYINTTTEDKPLLAVDNSLSQLWESIDLSALAKIGFTKEHLHQLENKRTLTPQIVQDSIDAFAFDLQYNDKAKSLKTTPINFFMGILRNVGVYNPPENYESPQDKAMKGYVAQQKAQIERKQTLEAEAFQLAFHAWLRALPESEKEIILLPEIKKAQAKRDQVEVHVIQNNEKVQLDLCKAYFKENIWPIRQRQILAQGPSEASVTG